jgi:uncharacterized spore protein YtfJ
LKAENHSHEKKKIISLSKKIEIFHILYFIAKGETEREREKSTEAGGGAGSGAEVSLLKLSWKRQAWVSSQNHQKE